jgi:hypothetical protein
MALYDVFDAIVTDFTASSVPCTLLFGSDHIAEHNDSPRIVMVPTSDSYKAAQYVSPSPVYDTMIEGLNPRTVLTRIEGGQVHIWASGSTQVDPTTQQRADYVALHNLVNQFILSLHRVNPGNYEVTGGRTIETTRNVRRGYVYVLDFEVEVPIIDVPWPTESDVEQDTTLQMRTSLPDGTVMSEVEF